MGDAVLPGLFVLALLTTGAPARATWPPEAITNLRVLPEEMPFRELVGVMRGFSDGLGVRCQHCHAYQGADPDDLAAFDFAADEKPAKRVAREMLRMTRLINEGLLPPARELTDEPAVEVRCVTCHRGRARPEQVEDVLSRVLAKDGLAATLARYRELRGEYHGLQAFDFGEGPINSLAEDLIRQQRSAEAQALLELNLEYHPDAERAATLYAEALFAQGKAEEARQAFQRVLEINSQSDFARQRLEELGGS